MNEKEAVARTLQEYLIEGDQGRDCLGRLVKISKILGRQGLAGEFAEQLLVVMRGCLRREGFLSVARRWLGLVDAVLEMDWKKHKLAYYRQAVGNIVVESYTLIFSLIFEYRAHDLIIDCKTYRLIWIPFLPE